MFYLCFFPPATGDGNCLLHAISLSMWGTEDEDLLLRRLLHEFLETNDMECRKRWQRERKKLDEMIPGSGLRYNTMVGFRRKFSFVCV